MFSLQKTAGLLAALGMVMPAYAVTACQLSATPVQMRTYGLAESVGEIVLRCSGGAPFGPVHGSLQVALSNSIANRPAQGLFPEVILSVDVDGTWQPSPNVRARRQAPNSVVLEGIHTAFGPDGRLGLMIAGIRAESGGDVIAMLSYVGGAELPVQFATVVVGRSPGAGLGAASTSAVPGASPLLPPDIDFEGLLSMRVPFLTTRITETGAAVLRPRGSQHETGTRVVVRFDPVPEPGQVFVPEAVAGMNALQPTSGGNLGLPAAGGLYKAQAPSTLLLGRVRGAGLDGAGGEVEFTPLPDLTVLTQVAPADEVEGQQYVVYEVLDSNHGLVETAQFPAWVVLPPGWRPGGPIIRSRVSLGPVSEVRGPSEAEPVPRFAPNIAGSDCSQLNDCAAPYFPRLRVTPMTPSEFTAPAGSAHQIGYAIVENLGGDILEWRVTASYVDGSGWIRIFPEIGAGRATIRFDVLPANLAPGEYSARLVVTGAANAGEAAIPILLRVTMPLPPVEPPPVILDVVKAGNRLPGPVAPGSLALVLGERFSEQSTVTVGGIPARVLQAEAGEILFEIPPALDPGLARALVQVNRGGLASDPWGVEIAPVAPAVLFALNEDDGERNGPEFPVETGSVVLLYLTGLELAVDPVLLRIHDRDIEELLRTDGIEAPDGVRILRFVVPEDLPAMSTAVLVCARAEGEVAPACAHPFDVSLRRP